MQELIAAAMACGLTADEVKGMVDEASADEAKGKSWDPAAAMKAFGPEDDTPDPRAAERAAAGGGAARSTELRRPGRDQPVQATVMQGTRP